MVQKTGEELFPETQEVNTKHMYKPVTLNELVGYIHIPTCIHTHINQNCYWSVHCVCVIFSMFISTSDMGIR